ncbi:MAG: hypothetical protein CVU46_13860 [Chloroflexi bacterium HGW-Chloroflexi-8]|nr:MAG: hypothetical protein CVU46_13860 [Chloroflexi bacterium HGW-Chloroflexi-8]
MSKTKTGQIVNPQTLAKVDLFENLAIEDLEKLSQSALPVELLKDDVLFLQGDPANKIYLLLHGNIKLVQTHHDGQQIVIRIAGPVEMIGALALGRVNSYPASAYAMSPCEVVYWTKETLLDHIQRMPLLAANTMHFMAEKIQIMQDRFRLIATQKVEQRLAHTLVNLMATSGKPIDEGILINVALSRQELAEMIGTTLYTVSRLLKQWENNHVVKCGRERIVITNGPALENIRDME